MKPLTRWGNGHLNKKQKNLVFLLSADWIILDIQYLTGLLFTKECSVLLWPSPVGWSEKMNNALVCLDGCPCCVPWISSKAFANFPSFPFRGTPTISRVRFSRAGQRQSSGTRHVSSKRTNRSTAGMLRRLKAIGISLETATWHSLFSFFWSLSFSVLALGCRMFRVFRGRWSCSSLSSEAQHPSKNSSNIN